MNKPHYPFRLGATSFVLPASVEENVAFLAPLVDDVQLLFFEAQARAGLPHQVDVSLLANLAADHNLSYTVHLPLDLRLGCADKMRRQADLAEVCRLVNELAPLSPLAFDLHLNEEPELPQESWLANLQHSLLELAAELGPWQQRLAIENIDYGLSPLLPLIKACGCSFCVDFGHLLRYGHGPGHLGPSCRHIHLHGVQAGVDHQALQDDGWLVGVVEKLLAVSFEQVVTIEVYKEEQLRQSLAAINKVMDRVNNK